MLIFCCCLLVDMRIHVQVWLLFLLFCGHLVDLKVHVQGICKVENPCYADLRAFYLTN